MRANEYPGVNRYTCKRVPSARLLRQETIVTIKNKAYATEIMAQRWLSKKTFEIRLRRPESFNFKPGQRISLRYKGIERDYSLASSPDETHLALCIRYIKKGGLSRLLGDATEGTRINFYGPHGYFGFNYSQRPSVLVATGTGIAPFRSMVCSGVAPELILHGVETSAELYYADELMSAKNNYVACLSQSNNSKIHYNGRVTDYIQDRLPRGIYDFYLCGRREMIRDVTLLIDERFEGSLVYTETFY